MCDNLGAMRSKRLAWLLAFPLLVACDWVTEVDTEHDPRGFESEAPAAQGEAAPSDSQEPSLFEPPSSAGGRPLPSQYQPPPEDEAEEEAVAGGEAESPGQEPREPERDLSSELRDLVGNPASCLRDLDPSVTDVTLTVRASTSVTGIVTRSSVSGAGLGEDARECLRRRVEGKRFRSPVPGAPRDVTAELTLRRDPPPEPSGEAGDEAAQARGTWRYGIFYPGGVPEETSEE